MPYQYIFEFVKEIQKIPALGGYEVSDRLVKISWSKDTLKEFIPTKQVKALLKKYKARMDSYRKFAGPSIPKPVPHFKLRKSKNIISHLKFPLPTESIDKW